MSFALVRPLLFAFFVCTPIAVHAQLPVNNDVWKTRCNVLANAAKQGSATPAVFVSATRGIPGQKFYALAVDRGQAGEHYVACALYFLSAISEQHGNGGKADPKAANSDAILAGAELKLARHQHLSMTEHLKRVEMKVETLSTPLGLTSDETAAVITASTTMPLSATPPPANTTTQALR